MTLTITKYVHACLLLKSDRGTVLIDPGQMSYDSGLFDIGNLDSLDAIAITHEHFDHFHIPFVQELVAKFPDVAIVSTQAVLNQLANAGVRQQGATDLLTAEPLAHESMEPLSGGVTADNILVNALGALTHPGDSHHALSSQAVFALPLAGPWGSAIDGVRMAEKLAPQFIIPIHDWMWNDQWRLDMYGRCGQYFKGKGITFLKPVDGQPLDIQII